MYEDGQHPLFPYSAEEKEAARRKMGLSDSTIRDGTNAVLQWYEKQPHLVSAGDLDRATLERMLFVAKSSIEKTKQRIENLYRARHFAPEIIKQRAVMLDAPPGVLWENFLMAPMPKLYDGRRITVLQLCLSKDLNRFSVEDLFRAGLMMADLRLQNDYATSDIWILNAENFTWSHVLQLNPIIMKKAANLIQDSYGQRIYAIHVINWLAPSYTQRMLSFLRQFFKSKIIDRVIFHKSIEDLQEHVSPKFLPKELGGDQPSILELDDAMQKEFGRSKTKEFLLEISKMVSDESKRPGGGCTEDFLAGSFRMLEFD